MFFFLITLAALVGTTAAAGSGPADDGAHETRRLTVDTDFWPVGCFFMREYERPILMQELWSPGPFYSDDLKHEDCAEHCVLDAFFGLAAAGWCYCGYATANYGRADFDWYGAVHDCKMPCSGGAGDICGGESAMAVYKYTREYFYIGCWKDNRSRILTLDSYVSASMTTEMCAEHCAGQDDVRYFGTQYGSHCFCGTGTDNYEKYGTSAFCNMPCRGDSKDKCGDSWAMSMYIYREVLDDDEW